VHKITKNSEIQSFSGKKFNHFTNSLDPLNAGRSSQIEIPQQIKQYAEDEGGDEEDWIHISDEDENSQNV
jgi:hypothetical protein